MTLAQPSPGLIRGLPVAFVLAAVAVFVLAGASSVPSVVLAWRASGAVLLLVAGANELRLRSGLLLAGLLAGGGLLLAVRLGGSALLSLPAQNSFSQGLVMMVVSIAIPLALACAWVSRIAWHDRVYVRAWNGGDAVVFALAALLVAAIGWQLAIR